MAPRGKKAQRGSGAYTLCARCNNDTGAWYGPAFAAWAWQAMSHVASSRALQRLHLPFHIFPLRVIKQIICMFCSTNGASWASDDMRRLLLQRTKRYLPETWRLFCFFNTSNLIRQTGIVARGGVPTRSIEVFSEIAFPPFGYVLTKNTSPPDRRLIEISHFANYGYDDWRSMSLNMPLLPIATWLPGDYRTKEKVARGVEHNKNRSNQGPEDTSDPERRTV